MYSVLVVLWQVVIFSFSAQTADASSHLSGGLTKRILGFIFRDFSNIQLEHTARQLSFAVRKSAHFIIYFVLGVLMYLAVSHSKKFTHKLFESKLKYSFLFCVMYSISDEIHQYFVPGRAFKIFDIFIDGLGSVFGILIICIILKKFKSDK